MTRPTELPASGMVPLRDAEAADWIEQRDRCAVLFWDPDDPVSRKQRTRVELAAAAAGLPVGVVDIRKDALVAQALGVESVPLLVVFQGGELVERLIGSPPEAVVLQALRGSSGPHPAR